jgi:hypothetical protein
MAESNFEVAKQSYDPCFHQLRYPLQMVGLLLVRLCENCGFRVLTALYERRIYRKIRTSGHRLLPQQLSRTLSRRATPSLEVELERKLDNPRKRGRTRNLSRSVIPRLNGGIG